MIQIVIITSIISGIILLRLSKSKKEYSTKLFRTLGVIFSISVLISVINVTITSTKLEKKLKNEKKWMKIDLIEYIYIDSIKVSKPISYDFSKEIFSLSEHKFHHSSPERKYKIKFKMKNGKIKELYLRKDSYIKNEYWIYNNNESLLLGSIKSDLVLNIIKQNINKTDL